MPIIDDPKRIAMMMDAFENNFQTVGNDAGNSDGMFPSPQHSRLLNSHNDDSDTATINKDTTGTHIGNVMEQPQAQDEPSSKETSLLFSWSTILATDSNVWEPYALNHPQQSSDDNNRRSEALQAFMDLAKHRDTRSSREEPRGEEEVEKQGPATKSTDHDYKQDMKSSTQDQESQSIQQKQRESIAAFLNVDYINKLPRIRDYQEQQWEKHYMDLCEFHQQEGHCCVPNAYKENPGLARWVKRQRYQYKLHQQGVSKSTMVPHRMKALERLGFVWDSHTALWEEQVHNLKAFSMLYGHCNVPSVFPADPQLATWVKRQRRLYRENGMPKSRQEKLNEIGFDWKTTPR